MSGAPPIGFHGQVVIPKVEGGVAAPRVGELPPAVEVLRTGHGPTAWSEPLAAHLNDGHELLAPMPESLRHATPENGGSVDWGASPARVALPEGWAHALYELSGKFPAGERPNLDRLREFGLKMQRAGNPEAADPQGVVKRFVEAQEAAKPKPPPSIWTNFQADFPGVGHGDQIALSRALQEAKPSDEHAFATRFLGELGAARAKVDGRAAALDERHAKDPSFTSQLYREGRKLGLSAEASDELRGALYDTPQTAKGHHASAAHAGETMASYAKEILRRPLHSPDNLEIRAREAGFILEAHGLQENPASGMSLAPPASGVYQAARELGLSHRVAMKVAENIHPGDAEKATLQPKQYVPTATLQLAGMRYAGMPR